MPKRIEPVPCSFGVVTCVCQTCVEPCNNGETCYECRREGKAVHNMIICTGHKLTADEEKIRKCRVCGCTDDHACPGGCWWVERDLCSRCAEKMAVQMGKLEYLEEQYKIRCALLYGLADDYLALKALYEQRTGEKIERSRYCPQTYEEHIKEMGLQTLKINLGAEKEAGDAIS